MDASGDDDWMSARETASAWGLMVSTTLPGVDKVAHLVDLVRGAVGFRWLKAFDPDAYGGRGFIETTLDAAEAMRFSCQADAIACWQTQSAVRPIRADGKPNRPLTAHTVFAEPLPAATTC